VFAALYGFAMFWPSMLTQHALTVGPLALLLAAITEREAHGGLRWLRSRRMVVLVLMRLAVLHSFLGAVVAYLVGLPF